jgi:8-oxo-dGTP pyrophosphatase MutT (NUDIX family)
MNHDTSAEAVPVRPAATVMLIREAPMLEVFMMRRTTNAAFASGMYVFPGGRVDATDGEGDVAFVIAAIREAFEEAGVLLARDLGGNLVTGDHSVFAAREDVHGGTIGFADLCEQHRLAPCIDELAWVAHWITPVGEVGARRFDTRFYVTAAPADQLLAHDDHETVDSLWVRPVEALERYSAGELTMMPPTIASLEFLQLHDSVASAMTAAWAIGRPPTILPKIRFDGDRRVAGVVLPGEPGYDGA